MRHAYRDAYPYEDLRDLGVIGAGAEAVRDEALTAIRRGKFWRVAAYFYAQKLLSDVTRDFLELFGITVFFARLHGAVLIPKNAFLWREYCRRTHRFLKEVTRCLISSLKFRNTEYVKTLRGE